MLEIDLAVVNHTFGLNATIVSSLVPTFSLVSRLANLVEGVLLEFTWYGLIASMSSQLQCRAIYQIWAKWVEQAIGTVSVALKADMMINR